jgi:phosphoribosylformylglycinamidine cyclo-ligase
MLGEFGIYMSLAGGETADLPDQLRTLDVSGAIYSRYKLDSVITGEDIKPGDTIIGLASGGKAKYEKKPSGALMCNGITLARHSLMKPELAVLYPEITEPGKEYTGPFSPTDKVQGVDGTIGEEITRPTRIFAPPFKGVIEKFGKAVHGIVFNTGGGHTKCLRIGHGIRYVKDDLPKPPAIFRLIQKYGHVPWREMYVDFNMGVGAELYVDPAASSEVLGFVREEFGIETRRIGQCKLARGDNKVRLETRHGNFNHRKNKVK